MRMLWACCLLAAAAAAQQLPEVTAENLDGKTVTLPKAAQGRPAVLVFGFTHGSQTETKAWGARLDHAMPDSAWSIAVLESVPRLMRGMVVHSIKGGIPPANRERFLVVFHHEKELKQTVGFDRADDAYLLVLDPAGAIRWRYHGPATDSAAAQLDEVVRGMR
jgi:hypothetical protein